MPAFMTCWRSSDIAYGFALFSRHLPFSLISINYLLPRWTGFFLRSVINLLMYKVELRRDHCRSALQRPQLDGQPGNHPVDLISTSC